MSSNDIKYPKWEEHKVKYAPVNDKYKPSREQWIYSWKSLIPLAAQLAEKDEETVEEVIEFIFAWLRDWTTHPSRKASFLIQELGSFQLNSRHIYLTLRGLIKDMRKGKKDWHDEYFRMYWKAWKISWAYDVSRKNTNRKFYPSKLKD